MTVHDSHSSFIKTPKQLVVTILLLRAQRTILGRRGYAVVGGKYGEPRRLALGPWRWAALAFCLFVLCFPVFLPYAALFKAAFTRVPSEPVSFASLTWHHVNFVFVEFSQTKLALRNTLILGAATATIGTVLAFVIAYLTTRQAIVGPKSIAEGKVELKNRRTGERDTVGLEAAIAKLGGAA